MEEKNEISARELLNETIRILEEISVPVKYALQISRPMSVAIQNIQACVNAMPDEPEPAEVTKDV